MSLGQDSWWAAAGMANRISLCGIYQWLNALFEAAWLGLADHISFVQWFYSYQVGSRHHNNTVWIDELRQQNERPKHGVSQVHMVLPFQEFHWSVDSSCLGEFFFAAMMRKPKAGECRRPKKTSLINDPLPVFVQELPMFHFTTWAVG